MMMLDFSPQVRAFSAQPFWLLWPSGGRVRRLAPDIFARLADGGGVVVDVRADDKIKPDRPGRRAEAAPRPPRSRRWPGSSFNQE
jgi:hypothetical protein